MSEKISVIIPAYNEEKMISIISKKISNMFEAVNIEYEIVFVNDGSKDNTWSEIAKVAESSNKIKGIHFARNFGKEAAIFAGLTYADGECCAVIDCDMQHPPEVLLKMYNLWKQGYEVVEGVKASRGKESFFYKVGAKTFYKLLSNGTGIDMSKASDFKLLDRKAVNIICSMPERHLFFRALSSWIGFKKIDVEFDVQERCAGETKWSKVKLVRYAIQNITSFSTAPMQIVTILGVIFMVFSGVLGIQTLIKYFLGNSVSGFTTVILILLIMGSALMISLGIMGYYIAKIYEEIKRRPRFIISHNANIGEKDE